MTEAEWLASNDPRAMLRWLDDVRSGVWLGDKVADGFRASVMGRRRDRKLRLFACACGRELSKDVGNFHGQTRAEVHDMLSACEDAADAGASDFCAIRGVAANSYLLNASPERMAWHVAELPKHHPEFAALLRDIVGNPFRRGPAMHHVVRAASDMSAPALESGASEEVVRTSPWLAPDVLALAQHAYESRDFAALPILADALEDAGCTDTAILDHCRGPGPHVRACWVLKLILGRE